MARREPRLGPRFTRGGLYPISVIAARTWLAVSARTLSRLFSTRDTVATETPAFFATATIDMLHIPEKTRRPRKYTRRLPRLPIFAPLQTSRLSINLIHMNGRDITALG